MSRQIVFGEVETWYKGCIGAKHPINWKFIGNYACYYPNSLNGAVALICGAVGSICRHWDS